MIINNSNYIDILSYFANDDILSNDIVYQLYKYDLGNLSFTNTTDRWDIVSDVSLGNSKKLGSILLTEDKKHYYDID
jgi:hypothetical protein